MAQQMTTGKRTATIDEYRGLARDHARQVLKAATERHRKGEPEVDLDATMAGMEADLRGIGATEQEVDAWAETYNAHLTKLANRAGDRAERHAAGLAASVAVLQAGLAEALAKAKPKGRA